MDKDEQQFRPVTVTANDPNGAPNMRELWRIGGASIPRRVFQTERTGATVETQELASIEARLRAHGPARRSTSTSSTRRSSSRPSRRTPRSEAALYKSYNRWMADIRSHAKSRLRWAVLAPTMSDGSRGQGSRLGEKTTAPARSFCAAVRAASCSAIRTSTRSNRAAIELDLTDLHPRRQRQLRARRSLSRRFGDVRTGEASRAGGDPRDHRKRAAAGSFRRCALARSEISASWIPHVCHDLASRMKRIYDRER